MRQIHAALPSSGTAFTATASSLPLTCAVAVKFRRIFTELAEPDWLALILDQTLNAAADAIKCTHTNARDIKSFNKCKCLRKV